MTAPVVDAESLTRREDDFSDGRRNVEDALESTGGTHLVNGCGSVSPSTPAAEALKPPSRASGEPISGASAEPLSRAATAETPSGASATPSSEATAASSSEASAATSSTLALDNPSTLSSDPTSSVSSANGGSIPIDQITQRLGIHSQFCFFCRGYYGPSFGQPICGTCHAFLYPERAGEAECPRESDGARQEEKDDSGDSGNEEPTDFFGVAASSSSAADRTRRAGGGGGGEVYSVGNPVAFRNGDGVDEEDDGSLAMGRNSSQLPTPSAAPLTFRQNPSSLEIDVSRVQAVDLDSPSSSSTSSSQSSAVDDIRLNNAGANADERPEVVADGGNIDCAVLSGAGSASNSLSRPARFQRGTQSNNNGTALHSVRSEKLAEKIIQMTTTKVSVIWRQACLLACLLLLLQSAYNPPASPHSASASPAPPPT